VDAIVLRMLEKDRSKRYQDVDELAHDIGPTLASNGRGTGPNLALLGPGTSPVPLVSPPTPAQGTPFASPQVPLASSPNLGSMPPQPRPYVLQHTTSANTASPSGASTQKIVLLAVIAALVILGALAGVYFGVIRQQQAQKAAPPPAAQPR